MIHKSKSSPQYLFLCSHIESTICSLFPLEISSKSKYYAIQQELSPEEIAQKRSVAEEMLKEIKHRKPFTNQRKLADEEENAAEECEF